MPRPPAHLNVPVPKELRDKLAQQRKKAEAEKKQQDELRKARLDWRKEDSELPPEFDGDPDPRHRERLLRQRTGLSKRSPLVSFGDLAEAAKAHTAPLEKRCIADVLGKSAKDKDGKPVKGNRARLARAYAICRASLQKSGRIKKGGMELTKLGKKRNAAQAKAGQHKEKLSTWKKSVVAARKK
jgi:hypothetical protein